MAESGSGAPGGSAEDETRVDVPLPGTPPAAGGASASPPAPPSQPPPPGPVPAPGGAPPAYGAAAGSAWAAAPVASAFAVPGTAGLEFAGGWPRFVAYIVDRIVVNIIAFGFGFVIALIAADDRQLSSLSILVGIVVDAAYFIGLWLSAGKATLGMRMLHLQVGNAFDGRTLDVAQAARRWVALGSWLSVLTLAANLTTAGSLTFLWEIVLLISVVASPTKQGLHDRFANSAVVRPIGTGSGGAALACAIVAVVLAGIALLSIVALIFLGGQVSTVLTQVGVSV